MANNILKSIKLGAPTSIEGGASPNTQFSIQSAENITKVSMKDEDAKCTTKGAFCSASIVVGMKAEEADNGNAKAKSRVNVNIHSTSSLNEQNWENGFDAVSGLANCITNKNGATPTQDSSFSGTFHTPVAAPSQVAAINEWAKTHGGGVVTTDDKYVQLEPKHGADAVMHANDGEPSTKEDWATRVVYRMADTGELKSIIPTSAFNFDKGSAGKGDVEYVYAVNLERNNNAAFYFNYQDKLKHVYASFNKPLTDWHLMFRGCTSLESIDLSKFDLSHADIIYSMFSGCTSLKYVNLDGVEMPLCTNIVSMFQECSSLESIDLSNKKLSKVTSTSQMFYRCSSLKDVNLEGADFSSCTNVSNMFAGCSSITQIDLSKTNLMNCENFGAFFASCSALRSVKMCRNTSCSSLSDIFYFCTSLPSVDLSEINTSHCTSFYRMFRDCSSLQTIDVSHFDTSNATNFDQMFYGCNSLLSLDIRNFDTIKMTTMGTYTFSCSKLKSFKVSSKFFNSATRETSPFTSFDLHRIGAWINTEEVAATVEMLPDLTTFADGRTGELYLPTNSFNLLSAQQVADAAAKGWNVHR